MQPASHAHSLEQGVCAFHLKTWPLPSDGRAGGSLPAVGEEVCGERIRGFLCCCALFNSLSHATKTTAACLRVEFYLQAMEIC
jgi:hypothetical protein